MEENKHAPNDSSEESSQKKEDTGIGRRSVIKKLLGASTFLLGMPLTTRSWGQPASPNTGLSASGASDASFSAAPTFMPSQAPAYPSYLQSREITSFAEQFQTTQAQSEQIVLSPTASPTASPTPSPTTPLPTTASPTMVPTASPTASPTPSPTTPLPTTASPTMVPTASPTASPTPSPTTPLPTTASPTMVPTTSPTASPTMAPSILPVELADFKGVMNNGVATLTWRTESETNNRGFEIQRSENGKDYKVLDWVPGQGTTTEVHDYQYIDRNLSPSIVYYYRLRQVDFDGQFEYSPVIALIYEKDQELAVKDIYPNPVTGNFANLEIITQAANDAEIIIFDATGRLVFQLNTRLKRGNNLLRLDLSLATNGTYIVRISFGNGESRSKRLVVAR
ncbi:MAG: T9SS type A sorting domain-containing protein [Bacteroidota bacterium]